MMSAEYDRLMQAWIAGTLTAEEESELFRLAEQEGELAGLLERQSAVNAGLGLDREGLGKAFEEGPSHSLLRAHVAAMSKSVGVRGVEEAAGENLEAIKTGSSAGIQSRASGIMRWIGGLVLIAGTTAGIYLGTSSSGSLPDGSQVNSPVVAVPSSVSSSASSSSSEADPSSSLQQDNGSGSTEGSTALSGSGPVTSSSGGGNGMPAAGSATVTGSVSAAQQGDTLMKNGKARTKGNNSIPFQGSIDTSGIP